MFSSHHGHSHGPGEDHGHSHGGDSGHGHGPDPRAITPADVFAQPKQAPVVNITDFDIFQAAQRGLLNRVQVWRCECAVM